MRRTKHSSIKRIKWNGNILVNILFVAIVVGGFAWLVALQVNTTNTFSEQTNEAEMLKHEITMLKTEVLALEICQNGTYQGALVTTTNTSSYPETFATIENIVSWEKVVWDDAAFFNPAESFKLSVPRTGRYAVAFNLFSLITKWVPAVPSSDYFFLFVVAVQKVRNTTIQYVDTCATYNLASKTNLISTDSTHIFNVNLYCEYEMLETDYIQVVFNANAGFDLEGNSLITQTINARLSIREFPSIYPEIV